jgi:hypothetical protein
VTAAPQGERLPTGLSACAHLPGGPGKNLCLEAAPLYLRVDLEGEWS